MTWCLRVALWAAACSVVAPASADEPAGKARLQFRWLAEKPVKGLTEEKGIQTSCGPDLLYPHLKPVLTGADVAEATLKQHDFSKSGLTGEHYSVNFRLSDAARKKLVDEAGDRASMLLAIFVDGRYWGTGHFQKARADRFTPSAGFFSSRAEAERAVEAAR